MNEYLTIREFKDRLAMNGVSWTEVWIRMQIVSGRISSRRMFNSRVVPASEVARIISEKGI